MRWIRNILGIAALSLLIVLSPSLGAEEAKKYEYRYRALRIDGRWHKFDRLTGESSLLDLPSTPSKGHSDALASNIDYSHKGQFPFCLLQEGDRYYAFDKRTGRARLLMVAGQLVAPPPPRENKAVAVRDNEADDDDGFRIARIPVITDADRKKAAKDIESYHHHLSILQSVTASYETLSGTIAVKNKGKKALAMMEVTLTVPTFHGKSQVYRFLLGEHVALQSPPHPASGRAKKPDAVFITVGVPVPLGYRGRASTRISYLKFADK